MNMSLHVDSWMNLKTSICVCPDEMTVQGSMHGKFISFSLTLLLPVLCFL